MFFLGGIINLIFPVSFAGDVETGFAILFMLFKASNANIFLALNSY
jgi:hypothetical protein